MTSISPVDTVVSMSWPRPKDRREQEAEIVYARRPRQVKKVAKLQDEPTDDPRAPKRLVDELA